MMKNNKFDESIYSYSYDTAKKRRSKADWAGINMGDAFKSSLSYFEQIPARKLYYNEVRKTQKAVAKIAGLSFQKNFKSNVKAQIGPLYTTYPSAIAALASIGLTAFLEFKSISSEDLLSSYLTEYLEDPAESDEIDVAPEAYKKLAVIIAKYVEVRLVLEDLAKHKSLSTIEFYRLFAASQENFQFYSIESIVKISILYGDILPEPDESDIHPLSSQILNDLNTGSIPFFKDIKNCSSDEFIHLGMNWVRNLCLLLSKYLPAGNQLGSPLYGFNMMFDNDFGSEENTTDQDFDKVPPLNGPIPPMFLDNASIAREISQIVSKQDNSDPDSNIEDMNQSLFSTEIQDKIKNFAESIEKAGGQSSSWEDMRSDLVEKKLNNSTFATGPLEGNPGEGHQVNVQLGENSFEQDEIFDRPVDFIDHPAGFDELMQKSELLSNEMRRTLYPNIEFIPEIERYKASGSIDPARLVLAGSSQAIYKRYRIKEKADRRGQPVLLIAADGSGSLDYNQMQMLKLLTTAWMTSTVKTNIQIMAGLYHSGNIREGIHGPLVQWMYHPQKTPSTNRLEAVKAVCSLPSSGTGFQSDALSISFMVSEAIKLARGRMTYLILLTDCAWNRSFSSSQSGEAEIIALFESFYREIGDKLHTTLVALGVNNKTKLEGILDKIITISREDLNDTTEVASKIGIYVASCLKERTKTLNRSN